MSSPNPSLSVVVTTYNWPGALDLILRALSEQTDPGFEVVVADDGSQPATEDVVRRWGEALSGRLRHVWQPDTGWRKARVLNLGALASRGDFLLFLDGDCLPRPRLVEALKRAALPGWFLATKRVYLSEELSRRVLETRTPIWRWSSLKWVARHRVRPGYFVSLRDRRRPWRPDQDDFVPPDNGFGFFFGVSRRDLERVNGWDMRFTGWGCEDTDLAVRARRAGLRCGWPGPGATVFHLWHARHGEARDHENEPLLFETMGSTRSAALDGLTELRSEATPDLLGVLDSGLRFS